MHQTCFDIIARQELLKIPERNSLPPQLGLSRSNRNSLFLSFGLRGGLSLESVRRGCLSSDSWGYVIKM